MYCIYGVYLLKCIYSFSYLHSQPASQPSFHISVYLSINLLIDWMNQKMSSAISTQFRGMHDHKSCQVHRKMSFGNAIFIMATCTFAFTYEMWMKRQDGERVPVIGNQIQDTLEESQECSWAESLFLLPWLRNEETGAISIPMWCRRRAVKMLPGHIYWPFWNSKYDGEGWEEAATVPAKSSFSWTKQSRVNAASVWII